MGDNSIEEFPTVVRETLFDVAENVLQTKSVKVSIEAGSKRGETVVDF